MNMDDHDTTVERSVSAGDARRQRAVMASDAEWERIGRAADAAGMDRSRYVVHRALMAEPLPAEVLRRAVRETLVLSLLEERRLRESGLGAVWEDACDAVDGWIEEEGAIGRLTDPGAANRWKALGSDPDGEDRLDEEALAVARGTGGIAHDAPGYADLMERLRALEAMRHLPEGRREWVRGLIARDARWRRDRKRVADFLGRARAALRARGDLKEEIRALHEPAGSASPDRGPPDRAPRNKSGAGSGRQGQAPDWRTEAEGVLRESTALVEAMPARELGAHLVAVGATLEEHEGLTARLRAMLGRGRT